MVLYALRLRMPFIELHVPTAETHADTNDTIWTMMLGEKKIGNEMKWNTISTTLKEALIIQADMVQYLFDDVFQIIFTIPERDVMREKVKEISDTARGACTNLKDMSWGKGPHETVDQMNESMKKVFSTQLAYCNRSLRKYSDQLAEVRSFLLFQQAHIFDKEKQKSVGCFCSRKFELKKS